jgi:hypothetical protein
MTDVSKSTFVVGEKRNPPGWRRSATNEKLSGAGDASLTSVAILVPCISIDFINDRCMLPALIVI